MGEVEKAAFVDAGRTLLKAFYLGLLRDAQTELQIQSVRLLKSRRGRVRISKDIVEIITSADVQDDEVKRKINEQIRMRKERLENWAGGSLHMPTGDKNLQLLGAEQPEHWAGEDFYKDHENKDSLMQDRLREHGGTQGDQDDRDEKHGTFSEVESESEDENGVDVLPNLTEIEAFFRSSSSFQVLLNGFKKSLLPQSLRDIVSLTSVEISNEEDESLGNLIKALVEDYTMLNWNWWPLRPRMRLLKPNESRLIWHCVSRKCIIKFRTLILYRLAGRDFGRS
jgi:hypothetical protein